MMKQTPDYHSLARLAVIQHLRSYGIKIKHWNSKSRAEPGNGGVHTGNIFGAPLHTLPQVNVPLYGNIPAFLVVVCKYLEDNVHTEGLFRKSGSVLRQKLLKSKLEKGEDGLSEAPPCDVASILKQFFRELPDSILPADLQDAFFKAQNLGSVEERISATMLISCLLSDQTVSILRYFFKFLHSVSKRCDLNRMDSNNLAVIFAPNLLHSGESEKISPSTEKKLRAQVEIVKILIDHPADIGCVPDFLLEKIPGMLGVDVGADTPGPEACEGESAGERKRRRRSVGVLSSMVTPLILTPSAKRKLPLDSAQGISTKKRKSIKQNLTFELLPNSLFGGGSTPASAVADGSPCVFFEASESSFSPSVSNLRRSKRRENRKVQRVESGKTGCFSPKISRTEMVRRSLRLRFSLGKSSKDVSTGFPASVRSQNIGWRLANSQEFNISASKTDAASSPAISPFVSTGSKNISKSEENLLTPKKSNSSNRLSWTGPHPLRELCDKETPISGYLYAGNCYSEPVLVTGKPPVMPKQLVTLVASSEQHQNSSLCEEGESQVQSTVQRITEAFTDSGSNLHMVVECSKSAELEENLECISDSLDAAVKDSSIDNEHVVVKGDWTSEEERKENSLVEKESSAQDSDSEGSVQASEVLLKIVEENDCIGVNLFAQQRKESSIEEPGDLSKPVCPVSGDVHDTSAVSDPVLQKAVSVSTMFPVSQDPLPKPRRSSRVSDQIHHFNKLCLNDNSVGPKLKSPIKFERTPVRQSVRRINSMSELKKQGSISCQKENTAGSPMVKAVSFDGSLSSDILLSNGRRRESSVDRSSIYTFRGNFRVPKQPVLNTSSSLNFHANPQKTVFEDLTNQNLCLSACKKSDLSATTPNNTIRILSGRGHRERYRGSPKNPIARVTLLPATKPLDL
ncbi:rho GTPase-activating protein 11A isoform X2 [Hyla sarda]|uniref:rho GTPase-activating protein 11A isoform X2 n=1 Tax=Hyla sarda TaxID=327740 RepID=UPI0024C451A4|nr:rho GTPase-activating protein 11A isoform X2 [Hyla sarda]